MDSQDKILNPFDFNFPKINLSRDGPTGQTLSHLQHVRVPVHDT